ncbi:hypothetical protein ERJ75_000160100 [Trypanosoma vivax]|nr:hypothetical protein ERJ75_000160100 [Trypanosoma vivax]
MQMQRNAVFFFTFLTLAAWCRVSVGNGAECAQLSSDNEECGTGAACLWAQQLMVVNATFTVLGELVSNTDAKAAVLRSQASEVLKRAAAVGDRLYEDEAQKAVQSAEEVIKQNNKTLNEVRSAKNVINTSLLRASSKFKKGNETKEAIIKKLLSNFSVCEKTSNLTRVSLEDVRQKIEGHLPNLTAWTVETEKKWVQNSNKTWEALLEVSTSNNKGSWENAWGSVRSHLSNVTVLLVAARVNFTAVEKSINATSEQIAVRAKDITQELTAQHGVLCSVSSQLVSLSRVLGNLTAQAMNKSAEAKWYSEKTVENMNATKKYAAVLLDSLPQNSSDVLLVGADDAKSTSEYEKVLSSSEVVIASSEKVQDGLVMMNKTAMKLLEGVRADMKAIKVKNSSVSRVIDSEGTAGEECEGKNEEVTLESLMAVFKTSSCKLKDQQINGSEMCELQKRSIFGKLGNSATGHGCDE